MAKGPTIEVKFTGDTKGLATATGKVEGELSGVGKKLSGFAVGAGAAITTMGINAIPQLVGLGQELFAMGQASETGAKKTETVFGDSAAAIGTWADDVNESLGLSDEAVGTLATSMGDLLVPMGFTREEAANLSMETVDAAGALSAWSEGKYDSAQVSDILTKAMLGEREGLKALGISISQAEVNERALTLAKADGREEISAQDKALATQALIMEKSTDAQTAWTDGTMDAVKQQNELKATIADAKEGLAKGLVPIVQKVIKWIIQDFVPAVKRLVDTFKRYWPDIKRAVLPVMEAIKRTIDNVITTAVALWEWFGDDVMKVVRIAFDYVKRYVENVMQIVQGVIDVVTGIISGDWGKVWEGIKKVFSGVWDQIKNILSTALELMGVALELAWRGIKNLVPVAWRKIRQAVGAGIEKVLQLHRELPGLMLRALGALGGLLWSAGKALLDGLKNGAVWGWTVASTWVKGLPGRLVSAVGLLGSKLWSAGKALLDGLKNGIVFAWTGAYRWLNNLPGNIVSAIGSLGSALWSAGRSVITGLLNGMKSAWGGVTSWLGGRASSIVSWKGPPEADAVMLTDNGSLIMQGLLDGMRAEMGAIERFANGVGPTISATVGGANAVGGRPSSGRTQATTIYQQFPVGVSPTMVENGSRSYVRTQGPV